MKIGDKVKVISSSYNSQELQEGVTGVIVTENDEKDCFGVKLDNGYAPPEFAYLNGHAAWAFYPAELEVIA